MFRGLLPSALLCALAAAQQKAPPAKPSPPPLPVFDVKLSPDPDLSIGLPDNMPFFSAECDADGNPYAYVWTTEPPFRQTVGFTKKGVITFATNQMTDIPEPHAGNFFVGESGIYMLVTGMENAKKEEVSYKDEAGKETKQLETRGEPRDYIARFDSDGSYRGALKLDVGFRPLQLATFGSGNVVVAGLDESKTPRVGLMNSSGQLLKYLQLPKDITDRPKSAEKSFERSGLPNASPDLIAMFAGFSSYHGNVLLDRSGSTTPIYEIRESGEVRAVQVRVPNGFLIDHLIPSDGNWFVDVKESMLGDTTEIIYEVGPEKGEILGQYRIESKDGLKDELSCVFQGNFTGLRHEKGRLTVLRGVAEPAKQKAVSTEQ